MKKLALIIVLTVIGLTSFAQLTLLHTFDDYIDYTFTPVLLIESNKYYHQLREDGTGKIYIYNADFSLERLCTITPSLPEGYTLSVCSFLGNNVINTDDDYEWFIEATNYSADHNNQSYGYITNSHGDIIYDFGYSNYMGLDFHIVNGQLRAILTKEYRVEDSYEYEVEVEIYSCGGTISGTTVSQETKSSRAYPNPATSFINLPFELNKGETSTMNIYDINGRLIEQKPIGYHFKNLELNVSSYKAGTYIYEYNGKSNRFVVQ